MDPKAVKSELVLILDYGSQYTHLITRRIRSLSVFSLCISGTSSLKSITDLNPKVVILSGGPHSVHTPDSPSFPAGFVEWAEANGVFVLGVCYGLQLIVQRLGGEVRVGEKQEYGRSEIEVAINSGLFGSKKVGDKQVVWMSHGDEVAKLPDGSRPWRGASRDRWLQLKVRLGGSMGCNTTRSAGWSMENVLDEEIKVIKSTVGTEDHVICALSGGVDSTVAATLVHKAIGDRLHCIFVDNGLLRYKEKERVMETFERDLHLPVTCVDATDQFLSELKGVVDPEKKRKIIGKEFISIFDAFAHDLEQKLGRKPSYLVQGTLYPDVIESCPPPGSGRTHSHTIKSHHNVGGLPKDMKLKLIEPLKLLFKGMSVLIIDLSIFSRRIKVRQLGRILDVPQGFLKRHPFPGPGLAVRVLGDVTTGNALDVLRQVDEIFIQSIKDAGLYDEIWQAFAVFLPVRSVGVQGDQRTHSHVVALRAVTSQDGMTADWYYFEHKFLDDVSRKICNSVRGVNRVVLDITSKPPSTIEWE
ncbi:GMP synthase [Prunus yedoensis var. nudiflora]|uniref:GMP synthase [glutamine-hydrolyzing] n=1 Tax=Prunus yedoensis var. nudiflora TaxID=2094558 RepID=A0A314UE40_PRUYE|nr:GMP synthase [Prunus yedoensis var. nudiflora]